MKFLCIVIGYLFGCFLTADVVARHITGNSACKIGTGNPGMANIGSQFGVKWAVITLFGDVLKTVFPCMLCRFAFFPSLGQAAILYAGFGAALGHAFPFWNKFKGGRSVAVTCTYIFLLSPIFGGAVELVGLGVVILTGYLAFGALLIPLLFLLPVFLYYGLEAGLIASAGTVLMFILHRDSLWRIAHKTEKKTNLLSHLKSH